MVENQNQPGGPSTNSIPWPWNLQASFNSNIRPIQPVYYNNCQVTVNYLQDGMQKKDSPCKRRRVNIIDDSDDEVEE